MKTLAFVSAFLCSIIAFGQGTTIDTTKRDYKNIVSIDATGLLRQFFNFNSSNYYGYSPYVITYRRVIKNNAARISIGGNVYTYSGKDNDTLNNSTSRNDLNLALGLEHYQYLGKKWTFYYGIDATSSFKSNKSKNDRSKNSYYESVTESSSFGLSPILGIVFQITNRISVGTETSYNLSYTKTMSRNTEYPLTQYSRSSTDAGLQSTFIPPTAINFRFKF